MGIAKSTKFTKRGRPRIVDFCSGGGHLGILLAHLLPSADIVLVENKEDSLRRASDRIRKQGLDNCSLFQCNLAYFFGSFDIGVSLHACGSATDLVMDKCLKVSKKRISPFQLKSVCDFFCCRRMQISFVARVATDL